MDMKNHSPYISIIIPAFNNKGQIERCIKSILSQSFSNFELIIVNDGSTDGTEILINNFAKIDQRIICINQSNQGVSSARNSGIERANGAYITFIDADDYICSNFLEGLWENTYVHKPELVIGKLVTSTYNFSQNGEKEYYLPKDFNDFISSEDYFSIGGKLFDNRLIQSANIKFHPNIKQGEDTLFILEFLQYCSFIATSAEAFYFYDNPVSSTKILSREHYQLAYNNISLMQDRLINRYKILLPLNFIRDRISIIDRAIKSILHYSTYGEIHKEFNAIDIPFYTNHKKPYSYKERILLWLLKHKLYWTFTIINRIF